MNKNPNLCRGSPPHDLHKVNVLQPIPAVCCVLGKWISVRWGMVRMLRVRTSGGRSIVLEATPMSASCPCLYLLYRPGFGKFIDHHPAVGSGHSHPVVHRRSRLAGRHRCNLRRHRRRTVVAVLRPILRR